MPFVGADVRCAVVLICLFPGIATALPDAVMGARQRIERRGATTWTHRLGDWHAAPASAPASGRRRSNARRCARRQSASPPARIVACSRRSSSRATASASKATTRSRPTSWRGAACRSTRSACTTCTWCSRCSRCPSISTCSRTASRASLDFSLLRPAGRAPGQARRRRQASRSARSTPTSSCSRRYFVDLTPNVALVAAHAADRDGNLYTGPEHRRHAGDRRGDRVQRAAS